MKEIYMYTQGSNHSERDRNKRLLFIIRKSFSFQSLSPTQEDIIISFIHRREGHLLCLLFASSVMNYTRWIRVLSIKERNSFRLVKTHHLRHCKQFYFRSSRTTEETISSPMKTESLSWIVDWVFLVNRRLLRSLGVQWPIYIKFGHFIVVHQLSWNKK